MLPHVLDFKGQSIFQNQKPWLVVGKGPTYDNIDADVQERFNIIGINQAAVGVRADVMICLDYEPFIDVGHNILTSCFYVWMPQVPHWRQKNGGDHIDKYLTHDLNLRILKDMKRLWSFDCSTAGRHFYTERAFITAQTNTSEVAIEILARLGVKEIHIAGIDGGTQRAKTFEDCYREKEDHYDHQWKRINELKEEFHIALTPL